MEQTTQAAPSASPAAPSTVNDAAASLALADSSFATPETPAPDATAAVQPAEPSVPVSTDPDDPRSPYIPRARFDEVNTRAKQAEEQLKAYEWAKGIPDTERAYIPDLLQFRQSFTQDPVGIIANLTERLVNNPEHVQALRSHMGRLLARRTPAAEPEPEPDLQTADGTAVYSAPQLKKWQEWNARSLHTQFDRRLDERLKPIAQTTEQWQQTQVATQNRERSVAALTAFKQANPEFTDAYAQDLHDAIANDPKLSAIADAAPDLALETAWSRVYRAKVLPAQQKQSEGQVLAHLQQRAVAATVNPSAATPTTPKSTLGDARAALEHAYAVTGAA